MPGLDPIDSEYVTHNKRVITPRNASLFVDGASAKASRRRGVRPQAVSQDPNQCIGTSSNCTIPCGPLYNGVQALRCVDGQCVDPNIYCR
jgi:hypothetical protein